MQHINETIFRELMKRGYSLKKGTRVWDISDSKLWYLTPALAKGFLKLKRYNPYRKSVVEREIQLIREHAASITAMLHAKQFNLIDLGCGSGRKAESFINSLPAHVKLRYCPVDISSFYLRQATERVRTLRSKKVIAVKSFTSDFKDLHEIAALLRSSRYPHNLILLLGETISHYEINDFLFQLSRNMFKGDFIVIGNGIRHGKRLVALDKYRAPLFNEWFIHILKALGFEESEVKYDARFSNSRVEGFYHVLAEKTIQHRGKKVHFRKDDEIVVAIQYKYFPQELEKFCKLYFTDVHLIPDSTKDYCLILCKK